VMYSTVCAMGYALAACAQAPMRLTQHRSMHTGGPGSSARLLRGERFDSRRE